MKKRKNNNSGYNNVNLHFANTSTHTTNANLLNCNLLSAIHLLNIKFKKQIILIGANNLSNVKFIYTPDANRHLQ